MADIFDELDGGVAVAPAPAKRDIFDDLDTAAPAPQQTADVFDELDEGAKVDPKPRLRRESFRMMRDAGRLSPRLQRDVADESSGIVGGTARALKNVGGAVVENISEAITHPFSDTEAFTLNSLFGETTGGKVAEDLRAAAENPPGGVQDPKRTKEVLGNFVKYFEGNGVTDGKEMMNILRDSIVENEWDSSTDDNARVLSDGSLRVNPKFVALPDAQEGIKAIQASNAPQEVKDAEVANFQQARKYAAKAFDEKAKSYDADYRKHAEEMAAKGVTDPEQVFYSWDGLDRNWIEGSWDVVRDTVAEAGRGIYNTMVKAPAMGLAELTGADEDAARIGKDIIESRKKSGYVADIAAARGQEGPVVGTGKELGTTVLEMAPMFAGGAGGRLIAGGAEAGAARQILGKISTGTSVYGYSAAQGYASLMQSALMAAEQKAQQEGRELTGQEINTVVEDSQGAALVNGFQTAILSKLLPEGAEKAAITGLAAKGMTGREVLSAIGKDGIRAAKPELLEFAKQAYRAGKVGFKDEALEEGVNQYIEGLITKVSGADADKTWDEIGQETFKGSWMGGVIGSGLPVAQKIVARSPQQQIADDLIQGAAAEAPGLDAVQAAQEPLEEAPASRPPSSTGLGELGGAGKAIADNFYNGIEKSLVDRGEVPSAEQGSMVGAMWEQVKERFPVTPENIQKFVQALRDSSSMTGDAMDNLVRALNKNFSIRTDEERIPSTEETTLPEVQEAPLAPGSPAEEAPLAPALEEGAAGGEPLTPSFYHGSPGSLDSVQPGSMLTDNPVWSAGYTTKVNYDLTEDFTGDVNEVNFSPKNPIVVTGWDVGKAENELVRLTREAPKDQSGTLPKVAKWLADKTGNDAIVVVSPEGKTVGMIPLVEVPVSRKLDPKEILRSQDPDSLVDNMRAALKRADELSPQTPTTNETEIEAQGRRQEVLTEPGGVGSADATLPLVPSEDALSTAEAIPADPNAYSKENLAKTFNLTPEQAEATDTLVQAMGLDTSKIALKKGGTPGTGLPGKGMLGQDGSTRFASDKDAESQGFSEEAFHGTEADFETFSDEFSNYDGIFFYGSPEPAKFHGPRVVRAKLKLENPKRIKVPKGYDAVEWLDGRDHDDIRQAKKEGYDGVIAQNNDSKVLVVFSPKQIATTNSPLLQSKPTADRVAAALPEAERQAAAAELGFEAWTPDAAQAYLSRLSDWLVSGKPDPLESSFRKVLDSDKNLFQKQQGFQGSFERLAEGGKMLLRGLTDPNVTTGLHELSHVARQTLFDRSNPVAGITADDVTVAENWAGAKDGKWDTKAEEKFARGFERYLRDGEAPVPELESVFAKIADWFRNIYQTLKGSPIDIQISPEMKAVFDRLVTRGKLPQETVTPAAESPASPSAPEAEITSKATSEPSDKETPAPEEPLVNEDGVIPPPPAQESPPGRQESLPPGVTGLQHAITDADRARLGLPPRTQAPVTTDQAAWDAAVDTAAADPNAGSKLLSKLMAETPRALTKYEHALLLHEKVRRSQNFNNWTKHLNDLPADASKETRNDASKEMQKALEELETLLTYADAAGSASGLSLQARKMLVAQDYSYAGVLARMLGAKNKFSDTKQSLTPAEMKEAAELSEKLQQAQARAESLQGEVTEQARLIEQLTKDIERAQERKPADKGKIRKALSARAEAAKARLKDKGFLAQEAPGQPDPSVIADAAAIAADWLVDEIMAPFDFLSKAVKTFGNWVTDHIDAIRGQADQIYRETAASVTGRRAPTPQEVMDSVDPAEDLDKATVWQVARALVVSGVRGENVLTEAHALLSEVYPELTRARVAELFTDYGKVSYPSKDDTTTELNKVRNLERTALKMLDLAKGVAPKRTGFQRGDLDAEVRKAEKEFRAALKASGIQVTDPEAQLKTALGAAKRRMENEIEELQLAIDAKTPRVKGSRGVELDEDGKRLKSELDAKRKAYAEAFPAEVDELQAAKDSTTASIDRYLQMLVRGDVSVPKKDGVTADAELEALRALRDTFAKQVREARNPKPTEAEAREEARQKAFDGAEETLAEIERKIAAGDLSKGEKKESPFAADLKDLREKIAAGRKKLAEMRKAAEAKRDPEEVRVERVIKTLDKQIAAETERLARGDLKDGKKAAAADTPEIAARREKLAALRQERRDLWEAGHPGETALEQAKKAARKAIENYRDILDGKTKPGSPAVTPDAELQALWDVRESLRDEVAEMRRALPLSPEAEARQVAAALKTAEENLARLEKKLAAGDLSVPTAKESAASKDSRVRAVRARVAELNKELARLRREAKPKLDPEVARAKRYLGAVQKRKAELERRMRDKDFSPKAKKAPVNTPESRAADYAYAKVKAEYQEKLIDHMLANATFTRKLGYRIRSTSNLMKVLTLGGDFGVLFRNLGGATTNFIGQDLKALLSGKKPTKSFELVREGLKAFADPKYEVDQYEKIVHRPTAGYDKVFGMKYAEPFEVGRISTEDIPTANLIDKIPWWVWPVVAGVKIGLIASNPVVAAAVGLSAGKIAAIGLFSLGQKQLLQRLDRAQRVMTNHARATLIDAMVLSMPGDTVSVEDGKAMATAVMVGTGRGQAKSLESFMPAIQTVALAARFYLSRIQALTLYPLYSGKMSTEARKQVAGMYGKSVTGRAAIYTLLALAFGIADKDDEEDLGLIMDPWSKDFGKVRVAKNTKVDVASGLNQWGHMMYRSITGAVRDPQSKKIKVYTPDEAGADITRFLAGRRSLTFGYLWDSFVRKEYYGGKPRTFATALDEATSAIILNDASQVFEDAGVAKGSFIMGLMLSGGGVNVGSYEREKEKWAELRAIKEEERQAREDRLNE